MDPGSRKTGGAGWDRVARKGKFAKVICSNPTVNAIFLFSLFFFFLFFLFLFKYMIFFFCLCCIKNYSPITILHILLSNLSQVYIKLNPNIL